MHRPPPSHGYAWRSSQSCPCWPLWTRQPSCSGGASSEQKQGFKLKALLYHFFTIILCLKPGGATFQARVNSLAPLPPPRYPSCLRRCRPAPCRPPRCRWRRSKLRTKNKRVQAESAVILFSNQTLKAGWCFQICGSAHTPPSPPPTPCRVATPRRYLCAWSAPPCPASSPQGAGRPTRSGLTRFSDYIMLLLHTHSPSRTHALDSPPHSFSRVKFSHTADGGEHTVINDRLSTSSGCTLQTPRFLSYTNVYNTTTWRERERGA